MKLLKIKSKHNTTYRNSDGKCHRDNDLPAVIRSNGYKAWWVNGLRHRDNNKPAIIESDGTQYWYRDGVYIKTGVFIKTKDVTKNKTKEMNNV